MRASTEAGTATTTASAQTWTSGPRRSTERRSHRDLLHRPAADDGRPERRGERLGQTAVPALDPERVEAPEAGAGLGEHGCVQIRGRVRARDLDARGDHLGQRGRKTQRPERVEDRALPRRVVEAGDCSIQVGRRDRLAPAWLAVAVIRALAVEPQAEAPSGRQENLVAREDELGAPLGHAARERHRPDPSADSIAGLEHDDLRTFAPQRVGGGESGQAGADDRDPHRREATT